MKKFELVKTKANKDVYHILEDGKPIEINGRNSWFKETAILIFNARKAVYRKRAAAAKKRKK
jgi:hypothetical protein